MITGNVLVVLVGVIASCCGLEMAKIKNSQGQSLTSSTLQWMDLKAGEAPPENALHVTQDGPLWCRANQRGTWAAGSVEDGKCLIPFLGKVFTMTEYDVLVSINGSARIDEVEWDRLQAIPEHGITTPDMLLAVSVTEDGEVYPGYISPSVRRASVLKEGEYHRQDSAKVLTEVEPVHYEVDSVVRNEDKSVKSKKEETVVETTLSNAEKSVQLVTAVLDYADKEIIYWGNVRGTITGLKSTVIDPSGKRQDITWGTHNAFERLQQQMVEYELPGEASINVKLVAVMLKYEAPYTAKLTSLYDDRTKRQHPISGFHIHTRLAELRADFSQPFFTENKTEIAGEYIPSQILIHSTTTTTTTTTPTPLPESGMTADGEKPQSDSLATSDNGSGHTRPVAEQMSSADSTMASLLLCFLSLALLLTHPLPLMH